MSFPPSVFVHAEELFVNHPTSESVSARPTAETSPPRTTEVTSVSN